MTSKRHRYTIDEVSNGWIVTIFPEYEMYPDMNDLGMTPAPREPWEESAGRPMTSVFTSLSSALKHIKEYQEKSGNE